MARERGTEEGGERESVAPATEKEAETAVWLSERGSTSYCSRRLFRILQNTHKMAPLASSWCVRYIPLLGLCPLDHLVDLSGLRVEHVVCLYYTWLQSHVRGRGFSPGSSGRIWLSERDIWSSRISSSFPWRARSSLSTVLPPLRLRRRSQVHTQDCRAAAYNT